MNVTKLACRAVVILCLSAVALAETEVPAMRMEPVPADQPIPAADFFRKEFMGLPALNGAGTHVAALMNTGDERWQLGIIELGSGKLSGFSGLEGGQVLGYRWLDDNTLLVPLDIMNGRYVGLFAVDVRSVEKAYPVLQFTDRGIVGVPQDEPLKPLVQVQGWGAPEDGAVVKIDATSRAGRWVELGKNWWRIAPDRLQAIEYLNRSHILETYPAPGDGGRTRRYWADGAGRLTFAEVVKDGKASLLHWDGQGWEPAGLDLSRYDIQAVEDGPQAVIAREHGPREQPGGLVLVDGLSGEEQQVLYRDDNYDAVGDVFIHRATGKVVGLTTQQQQRQHVWFDEGFKAVQDLLNAGFKGRVVDILDSSKDGRVLLFRTISDRDPETYYTFDAKTKKVALLKSSRPWLGADRMGRTHHFQYRSDLGYKLDAYLTLPATAKPQEKLPLVVFSAGPGGNFDALYNDYAQFWASRGYAVLRALDRGSEGQRWRAGRAAAGDHAGMASDLNAAVRTAIKTGVIDGARVAIYGLQEGGYIALLAAAREDSLYQAVMLGGTQFDRSKQRPQFGPPEASASTTSRSPVELAPQLRAPVLVANSDFPWEGGLEAPRDFIAALKSAGVVHESLMLEKGRAFTRDLSAMLEFVERQEAFLKKHL